MPSRWRTRCAWSQGCCEGGRGMQGGPLLPSAISCPASPPGLLRTGRGWRGGLPTAASRPACRGAARGTSPGQASATQHSAGAAHRHCLSPAPPAAGASGSGPSEGFCADLARRSRLRTLPGSGDVLARHIHPMGTTLEDGRDRLYFTDEAGAAQRGALVQGLKLVKQRIRTPDV